METANLRTFEVKDQLVGERYDPYSSPSGTDRHRQIEEGAKLDAMRSELFAQTADKEAIQELLNAASRRVDIG